MEINFEQETPEGLVIFKGELNKEETDFLLKFAVLTLLARGALPVTAIDPNDMSNERTVN